MIPEIVARWEANKEAARAVFAAAHPKSYKDIVTTVIVAIKGKNEYNSPSPDRIVEINHGDYQGTLLYLIAQGGYQPNDYWYVRVSYGSCSGCDTLESIRDYERELPTAKQVDDYMTLALHIVQGLKKLDGDTV